MQKLIPFILLIIITNYTYSQDRANTKTITYTNKINESKKLIGSNTSLAIKQFNDLKKNAIKEKNEKITADISYELALVYMNITNDFDKAVEETKIIENLLKKIKTMHYSQRYTKLEAYHT